MGQKLGTKTSELKNQLVVLELDEIEHVKSIKMSSSLRKLNPDYFYFIGQDDGASSLDFFQLTP